MTAGPVTSWEENIPVQKSYKEEDQDFSIDGKKRYYDTRTDAMKEQIIEYVQQKFSCEKYINLIISSKTRHKVIEFVRNTGSNKQDCIATNIFCPEESIRNYIEMNVQSSPLKGLQNKIVNFENDIYNTEIIQEQKNADIKELPTNKKDKGLNHMKQISGNITHFDEDLKKICSPKKSENLENKEEQLRLVQVHEDLIGEENLSGSENEDACSHSESEGDLPTCSIENVTEDKHCLGQSNLVQKSTEGKSDPARVTPELSDAKYKIALDNLLSLIHKIGEENLSGSENEDACSHSESEGDLRPCSNENVTEDKPCLGQSNLVQKSTEGKSDLADLAIRSGEENLSGSENEDACDLRPCSNKNVTEDKPCLSQSNIVQKSTEGKSDLARGTPELSYANLKIALVDILSLIHKSDFARGHKPEKQEFEEVTNETPERYNNKYKSSIVECDSKETMARVKELVEKMINRQLEDLEELEFRCCHLKKEHLKEFLLDEVLMAVECKISKLSIGYTKNVTDLIPSYCRIASNYKSTKLSLVFNDLKNEDITALFENLDEKEEYEEIDMSYNRKIGPAGYENIGKMVEKHRVRAVRLADCDISDNDLHRLFDGMGDAKDDKYMELDISYNSNIKLEGYENVGKNVQKHEVRTLRLVDCNISDEDLKHLFNGMGNAKLEVLDISCTNNLTIEGFGYIGKQVAKNCIKRLKLSDTQLNVETLTAFYNEVACSIEDSEGQQVLDDKYMELDISHNRKIEPEGFENVGKNDQKHEVRTLRLADCNISDGDLKYLFNGMGNATVEEIDVSYNSNMEPEAYKVLGSMVKLFGVKKLSLAGCGLRKEHLRNFGTEIDSIEEIGQYTYSKMKSLNAGDNTSIGEGIVEIAKIVNECHLEELDISDCRFSANELKDFIKALKKAKLKCLYLGEKRQFDENYITHVCNLLPHIKETLHLQGTVRNQPRKMLQEKLNILRERELEIKLDDDVTLRAQIKDEMTNSS